MSGLWKTSQWVRLFHWDLVADDLSRGVRPEDVVSVYRQLPTTFFYLAHRLYRGSLSDAAQASLTIVPYQPVVERLLRLFDTPRTPYSALAAAKVSANEQDTIRASLRTLMDLAFIVPSDAEEPIDLLGVFRTAQTLYPIYQLEREFLDVLAIVAERRPKRLMEIGTARGGTLFCWAQVADPQASLLSLDLPGGPWGGGYYAQMVPHLESVCQPRQRLTCLLQDSRDPETRRKVEESLNGEPLDMLFIDGGHDYETVRNDFERFAPLVGEGGLVVLHDVHPSEPTEVPRYWREIRDRYVYREFFSSPNQTGCGIGVLYF